MSAAVLGGAGCGLLAAAALRPRRAAPSTPELLPARLRDAVERRLRRADLSAPAGPVVAGGVGALLGLPLALLSATGSPLLAVLALLAAPGGAETVLRARERRHPDRVAAQLPGVIRGVADGLSAGRSLRHALARAAQVAPEPAAAEMGLLVDQVRLGGRLDTALADMARRCPRPEVELLCGAILVNASSGGNLARVLSELAGRLDARRRLERELRGLGAQARMTAWLVGALPALGAVVVEASSPGLLGRTLLHGLGRISLAVAAALMGGAVVLIRRIGAA